MRVSPLLLDSLIVGDDASSWSAAGFTVVDGSVAVGATTISCAGDDAPPRWRLRADGGSVPASVDGIATSMADADRDAERDLVTPDHPNRVVAIDHVVLASPDLDRTTETFAGLGVDCRRIRDVPGSTPAMQQRFFRLGPVILELVGSPESSGDGPASIWGLAFTVDDIDAAAAHLGSACGAPKSAVQPGRRIATVRTRDLGISLPVALMSGAPPAR
ncbi:VOC family protein [Actinospongicola halichondriae]|uniref:VOC family protein n=1 Tax=Actinospongicola halichondriae TaxID=3236844 RepID=UPI003D3DC67D